MTYDQKGKVHIAISCEYLGVDFHGWQRQENAHTVQAELEDAWFDLTGEGIIINGCSRTDAGVSARRHISSFYTETGIPVKSLTYSFYLSNTRPVIERFQAHHVPQELDIKAMRDAASSFLGEHNFSALMDQGSPTKRPCRGRYSLILEEADPFLYLHVIGDGFLYHMVRILAGTLLYVGLGKLDAGDIPRLLLAADRTAMGPTLPAHGLTLERVFYKEELFASDRWPYSNWQGKS